MPGILLRELSLWLAAGALNVRAEGALRFPEDQDISALRLSFIRLSPTASLPKRLLIALSPPATGLAAIWAIAANLLPPDAIALLATAGNVTELGAVVAELMTTADLWLWLYIAFTVANCAMPGPGLKLTAGQKLIVFSALLALCFSLWRAADMANPAIALSIEGLLGGLALLFAQIILLNVGCVLVLGAFEAVIERITIRSATFRDGKMITTIAGAPAPEPAASSHAGPQAPASPTKGQPAPVASIYDMKLPIPGQPGREPVSRQAVAVVSPASLAADNAVPGGLDRAILRRKRTDQALPDAEAESAHSVPIQKSDESVGKPGRAAADHDTAAPFARPFARPGLPGSASADGTEAPSMDDGEPFARPFVAHTESDQAASASDRLPTAKDRSPAAAAEGSTNDVAAAALTNGEKTRRAASQTRPAPKPSRRAQPALLKAPVGWKSEELAIRRYRRSRRP